MRVRPVIRRASFSAALVTSLVLAGAPAAALTDQERSAARELAERGDRAYRAGEYQEALDLFRRAAALVPAPTVLVFVARSNAQLGRLIQAREAYRAALRQELAPDAPPAFFAAQASARTELDDVDRRLPRVTVTVRGVEGMPYHVLIDGVEMSRALLDVEQPIDPGEHVFEIAGEGVQATSVTRPLADGSRETVFLETQSIALSDPVPLGDTAGVSSRAPSDRPLAYVSLGVGVLGLGFGTFMGVRHFSRFGESSELFDACNPRFCNAEEQARIDELDRQASTAGTLAIVGIAAGAVGVGTGLFLLLRTPSRGGPGGHPSAELRLLPGGAGLKGTF